MPIDNKILNNATKVTMIEASINKAIEIMHQMKEIFKIEVKGELLTMYSDGIKQIEVEEEEASAEEGGAEGEEEEERSAESSSRAITTPCLLWLRGKGPYHSKNRKVRNLEVKK